MDKSNKEMLQEMELQLHGQFSADYDSGLSATITLFTTLLAVMYGYGYIFLHSVLEFRGIGAMVDDDGYSLDALLFATLAAMIVLSIMKYVSVFQGINLRLQQFIVYAIRKKNCNCRPEDDQPRVFPENYHPFGKKGNKIVVGIYGDFIMILSFIQVIVLGGFVWKLFTYAYKDQDTCISRGAAVELFIFLALSAYTEWRYREEYRKMKNKYHKQEEQYLH